MKQLLVEFSDVDYTKLRKNLLRKKGSNNQIEFLEKVRDSKSFINHMEDIDLTELGEIPILSEKLTENEFNDPPIQTEYAIYSKFKSLSPAQACRSSFWANVTLEHLRSSIIESSYLAANRGSQTSGLERIDHALSIDSDNKSKRIDDCVRTVLRRLGGLPERGKRSVYTDCPFARAWWREYMVNQATKNDDKLAKSLRKVIRSSPTYWEEFINRVVIRSPLFGSENVRSAFLRSLAIYINQNPNSSLFQASGMKRLCRRAGVYQGLRELSVLEENELNTLMTEVITNSEF
ncbi:MAG: DUF6339 family protein [Candidatus Poribacteria bacterium]|nr:DUF6339 family protein [Candidatus Poribacteria bacterium]